MSRIKYNEYAILLTCLVVFTGLGFFFAKISSNSDTPLLISSVFLSSSASLIVILIERLMSSILKFKHLNLLVRNDYKSYSYTGDPNISTTLKDEPNEKIKCEISRGKNSDLEITVTGKDDNNQEWFEWKGFVTMQTRNTGEIAYRHIKDKNLQDNGINSIGYKKLFTFIQDNKIRIYISQSDNNSNFSREVFIADVN